MDDELDSIKKNKVWELVELPKGRKPIGCKWIFKKKFKYDGTLDKYKARLVAKGYTQKPGVDYEETYSPMAKFVSIRIIMALVAKLGLELFQFDVKTAFLNGELKEDIYMEQPKGFEKKDLEDKVYKLTKSLYGLKQSSRQWYLTFHKVMLEIGYEVNPMDNCVYMWKSQDSLVILSLYVDDILLAGNNIQVIERTKSCLKESFEMKDMGPASYVLGIRIIRDRKSRLLYLDQEKYIEDILKKYNMNGCKTISTPTCKGVILSKSQEPKNESEIKEMQNIPYAQAVGSLMFAMTRTKPDICYSVGLISRYQSNLSKEHYQAVKRILRYI